MSYLEIVLLLTAFTQVSPLAEASCATQVVQTIEADRNIRGTTLSHLSKSTLDDIHNNYKFFNSESFWDDLENNSNLAQAFMEQWYSKRLKAQEINILNRIYSAENRNFFPLVVDPGIIAHAAQFLNFIESNRAKLKPLSLYQVRNKFSAHLGTTTVYRGLGLTPNQMLNTKSEGILAPIYTPTDYTLKGPAGLNSLETHQEKYTYRVLDGLALRGPATEIQARMIPSTRAQYVCCSSMSVTKFENLAAWVANRFKSATPQNKIYVFEIEIPKIDLVPGGLFAGTQLPANGYYENGKFVTSMADSGIESFTFLRIEPEQIRSVKLVEDFSTKIEFK